MSDLRRIKAYFYVLIDRSKFVKETNDIFNLDLSVSFFVSSLLSIERLIKMSHVFVRAFESAYFLRASALLRRRKRRPINFTSFSVPTKMSTRHQ